jgi:Ca2+-binding EF-hand superfamily protein
MKIEAAAASLALFGILSMPFVRTAGAAQLPPEKKAQYQEMTPAEKAEYQKKLFNMADANHDGKVTEKEYVLFVAYSLFKYYAQGEDKLTKQEYMKALSGAEAKNAEAEWKLMDPEGKGYVTFKQALRNKPAIEEFKSDFQKLDRTGRGYITLKDLPAVKQ